MVTCKNAGLTLAKTELRFQIFRQENDKTGNYNQFHAGAQAGDNVDGVAD